MDDSWSWEADCQEDWAEGDDEDWWDEQESTEDNWPEDIVKQEPESLWGRKGKGKGQRGRLIPKGEGKGSKSRPKGSSAKGKGKPQIGCPVCGLLAHFVGDCPP